MAPHKTKIKRAKKLSLPEKVGLLYGDGPWTIRGVKRIGVAPIRVSDGPCGLRKVPDDSLSLKDSEISVAYPCPALVACSFDDALMEKFGRTLGGECKAHGVDVLLGPGINIKRNPLCGRNFEYYSEDPYLSGMLAASFTKGIQGVGVGACLKHFACNSQETYRMVSDSIVDLRALHEIYLRAFQIAIEEANPWSVMASYNKVNGSYACESKYLLTDVLRTAWNYDGVVMSDWGGVSDPIGCHDQGLDVEMPCYGGRSRRLSYAARKRSYFQKVTESARRVCLLSERTRQASIKTPAFRIEDAHALAVSMAESSCVLARNENKTLPLKSLKGVAIIGEFAIKPRLGGGGSSQVRGYKPISFYDYACKSIGASNVAFSQGFTTEPGPDDPELILDAVEVASRCSSVVLFLGTAPRDEAEGFDRGDLHLEEKQIELYNRIFEVNKNIIVVLNTGAPIDAGFLRQAPAILISYFAGEGGGEAIYNLLTGKACPSGHLAETWPARAYEVPSFGFYPGGQLQTMYYESIYVGYRYYLTAEEAVLFPFGHGLSYTSFSYGRPRLSAKDIGVDDKLTLTVAVTNKTKRPGDALVQVYVQPKGGNVFKAKRTLQAYRKVHLEGEERKEITLELTRRAFEHFDPLTHSFQVEGGEYLIQVGESCADIVWEGAVNVHSDATFPSKIETLSIYYQPSRDGFWQYDSAFERLLGHVVAIPPDPRARPYHLNSTFGNIKDTFIGKKILAKAEERFAKEDNPEMMKRMMLEMPIRNIILAGIREKYAQIIVDLANGKPMHALWHFLVGRR